MEHGSSWIARSPGAPNKDRLHGVPAGEILLTRLSRAVGRFASGVFFGHNSDRPGWGDRGRTSEPESDGSSLSWDGPEGGKNDPTAPPFFSIP